MESCENCGLEVPTVWRVRVWAPDGTVSDELNACSGCRELLEDEHPERLELLQVRLS